MHNEALPFYAQRGLEVKNILAETVRSSVVARGTLLTGSTIALNEIEHRTSKARRPQTNGFVERHNRTVELNEFFRKAFREKLYESAEVLHRDLDERLSSYNRECPHQGYRNAGRRPMLTKHALKKSFANLGWDRKVALRGVGAGLLASVPCLVAVKLWC